MKKIGVKKDMHYRDVKDIVKGLLEEDEVIASDCLVENSGAVAARIGVGIFCGIGLTFNDYADHFKVVATNKRLLLVGISRTVDLITGVRSIEYKEIKSLKMTKNMNIITMTLNDGKFFELMPVDFSDNKSIIEKSQRTFRYIASNIDKDGVITRPSILTSEILLIVGFTLFVLAILVPNLIKSL